MSRVQIHPELVSWAAAQAGLDLDSFAQKLSTRHSDKIKEGDLSEAQAKRAAKIAKIKLYQLFLETPPSPPVLPLADFRTLQASEPLSKDFYDVYHDIEYKQLWFKEYLLKEGADKLSFVGKFNEITDYKLIASDLREMLAIDSKPRIIRTPNDYYSFIARKAEKLGVLVFKNGVVGNNTSRPLNVSEFRGFAISDSIVPVVFINGRDSPAAWVFTLVHELAHIWRGDSAISDASSDSKNREEILCNKIAAETLVPEIHFRKIWEETKGSTDDKLLTAQSAFVVSIIVVARRALDFGLISQAAYAEKATNLSTPRGAGGGGNFYTNLNIRNSKALTKIVTDLAAAGKLSFKEAGKLLQTTPANVMTAYKNNTNAISS